MDTIKTHRKRKIGLRLGFGLLLLIFLLVLAVMLFSPSITRNYLNKHGKELTGRTLSIDRVKINFFTTTLNVTGAKMLEPNDSDVFVGFDTLIVNLNPLRLLKKEIHVQQFKLVNLKANIIQNDTVFNFSDLIERFASEDTIAQPEATASDYSLNMNLIGIENGSVSYTDQVLNHTIALNNITFLIPHLYWGGESSSKADVAFELGSGGSFASSLDYNMETGEYSGTANLTKISLGMFLPYVQEYMDFGSLEGTVTSTLNFSGSKNDLYNFSVHGEAQIDSAKITDRSGKTVLGLVQAHTDLKNMKPLLYEANMGKITIDQPYMYLELADSTLNFERMIVESTTEEPDTGSTEDTYRIYIDSLRINDGLIDFTDLRFREKFDYELSKVSVNMDNLALDADWFTLNASMLLNKRGHLEAKVGLNPYDPLDHIELEYVLSDFQLPDVNIYSKYYTGLPILFGDMYYVNKTTINKRQLDSQNKLLIRNVEMGRKTGGLYDVPVKLALFILKDINGDVNLDIPVTGDLSDPRTRIGKIVWNTFKQFMFKIVASPFKALGNLLDASPTELEEITFLYSDTTLVAKQRRSLDLLLELEKKKPGLQIDLQYLNDRKLERADAAAQIAEAAYRDKTGKEATGHRNDYLNFLKETTGQDSLVMQDYERLFAPVNAVDSILQQREQMRIDQVRNYLTMMNDSTRITVQGYNSQEVLNIGSRPRFTIKYSLSDDGETNGGQIDPSNE